MKRTLDFIIIGAQKSGTTTLFEYLRHHPALEVPAEKEAPFFSDDACYATGMDAYLKRVFPFADQTKLWGTVTPQYMVGGLRGVWYETVPQRDYPPVSTVPSRIRATCPEARLIAILRDPTERSFSHYRQNVLFGWEQRPFDRAIEELLQPTALREAREDPSELSGYVVWGEYARILEPYFELFGNDQLLVLFTDELRRDPDGILRRMYAFLGVDQPIARAGGRTKLARVGATERRFRWLDLYYVQRVLTRNSVARALWHGTPWRVRRKLDRLYGDTALHVELWNRRAGDLAMSSDTVAALRAHFRDDTHRLTQLIGCVPPWAGALQDIGTTAGHP